MSKFSVGDKVIVKAAYNERRRYSTTLDSWEAVIAKVGRKYVYLEGETEGWKKRAYDAETGHEKTEYPGNQRAIYTPQEWADKNRRTEVIAAIREHGLDCMGYGDFKQSTATLEKVLAVLDGEERQ